MVEAETRPFDALTGLLHRHGLESDLVPLSESI